MITIAIDDNRLQLAATHFRTVRDAIVALQEWEFSQKLAKGAKSAAAIPLSKLCNS